MERFTISLDQILAPEFDRLIRVRHSLLNLVPVEMETGRQHIHSHPKI